MSIQPLITFERNFHVVPRTALVLHPHLDQLFGMLLVKTTVSDVLCELAQMDIPTCRGKARIVGGYDIVQGNLEVTVDGLEGQQ